jgi:hypothetical protein
MPDGQDDVMVPSGGSSNDTVSRMSNYPYARRFTVARGMPSEGRARGAILDELSTIAREEDEFWETGKCSGTMYCGDHEHYDFLNRAFALFSHVNALQRDMCPSQTRFEGEIIAMTLDMLRSRTTTRPHATEPGQARDRAPRVRQGVSPLRYRVPKRADRLVGRTSPRC